MDNELIQALKDCGAVKFGDFTLASGRKSKYYIDIKKATSDPGTLTLIAGRIMAIIKEQNICVEAIGGVAVGGIPLATAVSLASGLPLVIIRKSLKDYGTGGRFIGDIEGRSLLMVEDVTTTGGSVIEAIRSLRDEGAVVDTVITVVDRDEGAQSGLNALDVKLVPLVSASDLLGQ
ncbi:MAG: orotate phosphoribosyltransferase [Methanosarcinales archaeon]|nr:orotate phosphoribosyltransferase [Methanosarcinales archaeon]